MSFNASLRQFREPAFAERVGRALADFEVHPTRLAVEITESTAVLDPTCVEPVLADLRRLGVRLAIDDFGVGHSALGRLRDPESTSSSAPAASCPGRRTTAGPPDCCTAPCLARALELTPAPEGVEHEDHLQVLLEHGCRPAQGFHLGRPMPAAEVSAVPAARGAAPPAARGAP